MLSFCCCWWFFDKDQRNSFSFHPLFTNLRKKIGEDSEIARLENFDEKVLKFNKAETFFVRWQGAGMNLRLASRHARIGLIEGSSFKQLQLTSTIKDPLFNFPPKFRNFREFPSSINQPSPIEGIPFIFNPWKSTKPTICLNFPNLRDFSFLKNFYSNSTLSNKQKERKAEEINEKIPSKKWKNFFILLIDWFFCVWIYNSLIIPIVWS